MWTRLLEDYDFLRYMGGMILLRHGKVFLAFECFSCVGRGFSAAFCMGALILLSQSMSCLEVYFHFVRIMFASTSFEMESGNRVE